ncbi:Transcription factor bHLH10, partial [Ananas comosus]
MFDENGYTDPSHDPNLVPNSSFHSSSQEPLPDNGLGGVKECTKVPFFPIEEFSSQNHYPSLEGTSIAAGLDHLENQLGFDIEQELHSHIIHGTPSMESATWEPAMQDIQDPAIFLQQNYENQLPIPVEQNIQSSDGLLYPNSYAVTTDLLSFMKLPRCTTNPDYPPMSGFPFEAYNELSGATIQDGGASMLYDPALHSVVCPTTRSHLLKDLLHSLPQNYGMLYGDEGDAVIGVGEGIGGNIFQPIDGRKISSAILDCRREIGGLAKVDGKQNFAAEKQRREQLNEKYAALKSLVPNPTKSDRASIVGDAIEYINELNRTIKELKILVEQKRHGNERRKMLKMVNDVNSGDMESSSMSPFRGDQDNPLNGALRSSWIQRRSKDCFVDVRIIDDEVNIKITRKNKANCLLYVAKVLDELQLELIHSTGATIGDHNIFMFNTKIFEGSSVYAGAVAKKIIEAMEKQYPTITFPTSF